MKNYNVQELDNQELRETNGGLLILAIIGTVAAVYTVALATSYYIGYHDGSTDCNQEN